MRKTSLFAIAATLIVAGVGAWAASATVTTARVAATTANGTANELPTVHYADYTFVFD